MPPSEATSQYPPPSGVAAMPTMGLLRGMAPAEPKKRGVAVIEDAAVGGDDPVPLPSWVEAMPTGGAFKVSPPAGPKLPASPKFTGWATLSG